MTFTAQRTYPLVMWFMLLDLNCQDADGQPIVAYNQEQAVMLILGETS